MAVAMATRGVPMRRSRSVKLQGKRSMRVQAARAPPTPSTSTGSTISSVSTTLPAALTASTALMAALPEYALAASSGGLPPSLNNLLGSVVAGGVVLGGLFGAVYLVSSFDQVQRK